jgi:pSer/pThr/pTyr-binding forkhead associated (FHA) protein
VKDSRFMPRSIDKHSASTVVLTSKKTLVGRAPTCDLVIPHLSVSRCHAELSVIGPSLTVQDLKSRNGTYVDENRIDSSEVRPGQLLRFGSITFLITSSAPNDLLNADVETQSLSQAQDSIRAEFEKVELTDAQRRVFELLLEGLSEKQVAARLTISPHTVHNHVRKIYVAARVGSRPELLARFVSREAFHRICIPSELEAE